MLNSLRSAATGMEAQQVRIDNIANDLANLNTVGYKKGRADFEDLYYDQIKTPGTSNTANIVSPNGIQVGHGTKLNSISKIFTVGDIQATGQQLDLALEGNGFFQLSDPNGNIVYSRNGSFKIDQLGAIVNSNGLALNPAITVPANTISLTVGTDGTVSAATSDSETAVQLGQIQLAMFQNPAGLVYGGSNIYRESTASGPATVVVAGENGSGELIQGFLEASNVNVGESLINMVVAQRSYESNSKVIETADRMMQSINNIV